MKKIRSKNTRTVMIFLKHFDTASQSLVGIGKIHMQRANKMSDLILMINGRMRWPSWTPLKLYEVPNGTSSTIRCADFLSSRK